jgi:hypothetical protein
MNNGAIPSAEKLKQTSIQVGKALNDPIKGVTALRRVGVQLTDGQQKLIEKMVKSGDVIGAQKVVLKELNKEFGGSAQAAGKTLPGQLSILNESYKNLAATAAKALLPGSSALKPVGKWFRTTPRWRLRSRGWVAYKTGALGRSVGSIAALASCAWQPFTAART